MTSRNNRCAIIGSKNSFGRTEFFSNMKMFEQQIDELLEQGINTYVTEASDGYELSAANYIIELKKNIENLHLVVVRPYQGENVYWKTKPILERVLKSADMVKYIAENKNDYYSENLFAWINSHCDTFLCITNTVSTRLNRLNYLDLCNKTILYIPARNEKIIESQNYPHNLLFDIISDYSIDSTKNSTNIIDALDKYYEKYLKERELFVVKERYIEQRTLQEVGDKLGISRERVRQIQNKALRKLKSKRNIPYIIEAIGNSSSVLDLKEKRTVNNTGGINVNEVVIQADQTPGTAYFENFNELKSYLQNGLEVYNLTEYSIDNIEQARNDFVVLKALRKKLTDKRKALQTEYTMPIEKVLEQIDELIEMVKGPYTAIDRMLKLNAKEIKRIDILSYARKQALSLGEYADKVINSPAFFNPRWCNASYREGQWTQDVNKILLDAKQTIKDILENGGENKNIVLGFYFDKLSLDGVEEFLNTVGETTKPQSMEVVYIDTTSGEIIDSVDVTSKVENKPVKSENMIITKEVALTGKEEMINKYLATAKTFGIKVK